MKRGALASKKNVIIIAAVILSVLFLLASYYMKQARLAKETILGAQVEITAAGPLPRPENNFMRAHTAKGTYVADMKTPLPLPTGTFVSGVRGFGGGYPLRGQMKITPIDTKGVFTFDKPKKTYGVAVNNAFLNQTGMRIGDTFTLKDRTFQLRGLIESLPDRAGQELMKSPLLMLRDYAEVGNGMWFAASQRGLRYLFLTKKLSPRQFQLEFKERFPKSRSTVNRADEQ